MLGNVCLIILPYSTNNHIKIVTGYNVGKCMSYYRANLCHNDIIIGIHQQSQVFPIV